VEWEKVLDMKFESYFDELDKRHDASEKIETWSDCKDEIWKGVNDRRNTGEEASLRLGCTWWRISKQ
jgi:hypothetical protein